MNPAPIPRGEIIERLERLYTFLGDEGWHVHANTVAVAIDEIKGAVEALRKPSRPMIEAGYKALMDWDARTGDDNGIWEVWGAMINQAIKEDPLQ